MGVSPGPEVMGGDSGSEGREFESQFLLLDGHISTLIYCKKCSNSPPYTSNSYLIVLLSLELLFFLVTKYLKS